MHVNLPKLQVKLKVCDNCGRGEHLVVRPQGAIHDCQQLEICNWCGNTTDNKDYTMIPGFCDGPTALNPDNENKEETP